MGNKLVDREGPSGSSFIAARQGASSNVEGNIIGFNAHRVDQSPENGLMTSLVWSGDRRCTRGRRLLRDVKWTCRDAWRSVNKNKRMPRARGLKLKLEVASLQVVGQSGRRPWPSDTLT